MQQIREAFPWEQTPRYVIRDRDAIYGKDVAAIPEIWEWRKCSRRHDRPGKIHMRSD